jgi:hypothetical protein
MGLNWAWAYESQPKSVNLNCYIIIYHSCTLESRSSHKLGLQLLAYLPPSTYRGKFHQPRYSIYLLESGIMFMKIKIEVKLISAPYLSAQLK